MGVESKMPINPKAEPMTNKKKMIVTGCKFIEEDRNLGIIKSPNISSIARKKANTHKAVIGLIESATNVGGMDIRKKPILGIIWEINATTPQTHAPGTFIMLKKTITLIP